MAGGIWVTVVLNLVAMVGCIGVCGYLGAANTAAILALLTGFVIVAALQPRVLSIDRIGPVSSHATE
jgi:hypothetical protein